MDDAEFLAAYDASKFKRPSVAVDLVLLTVHEKRVRVLLHERQEPPFRYHWGLPGTFVQIDEPLEVAAARVLRNKAHLQATHLEQLYTFGAPDRDPRLRVISVSYFGLLPAQRLLQVVGEELRFGVLAEVDGRFEVHDTCGEALKLPFDHEHIIEVALERLRAKLDWSDVAFALLGEEFTLRELQYVHEAIRGVTLNKPAFRRRMLDAGRIEPTGRREPTAAFRPAELYRMRGGR